MTFIFRKVRLWVFSSFAVSCLGACVTTQGGGISEALDNVSKQINESVGAIGTTGGTGKHPVYEPINPARGTFPGVFKGPHIARYDARETGWPRVAITYLEWGRRLECWTARADIWENPKNHHSETFRVCDVPYIVKDDVGGPGAVLIGESANGYVGRGYIQYLSAQYSRDRWSTTGETRTTGPVPPKRVMPSIPTADSDLPGLGTNSLNSVKTLRARHDDIYARIAFVSGFINRSSGGAPDTLNDVRLWVAGFDQAGKKD